MGPYCKFCGQRCFVPVTEEFPERIKKGFSFSLMATCEQGKANDKEMTGLCYDDAKNYMLIDEMLSVLHEVADYLSDMDGFVDEDSQTAEIIRLVNDAIAKAEGE